MRTSTLDPAALDQLRRTMRGVVIAPPDAGYDDARRLWNGMLDRRPAVIARPPSAQGVAAAIAFGREHDLAIAVRSGGHSTPGVAGPDGGLVIDLAELRGVTVDPHSRIARVSGGALLGELDVAAQAHGLVCPVGVVGHTGVAGLTLGGGIGRLQRNFGLTIDSLRAVELVTADGRLVRASRDEEPELFWGIRGAGWNFGIVTEFEFELHPFAGTLHRGVRTYPASEAADVWATFDAWARAAPDAVAAIFNVERAGPTADVPDALAGQPIVYVAFNHSGAAASVERDTAGLRLGPTPVSVTSTSQDYREVQAAHDLVLGFGRRSFLAGLNAGGLRPEALAELVRLIAETPAECTFSVTALGGAIARVPEDETAYAGRAAAFDLSADAAWEDPAQDDTNRDFVRRAMALVEPDATLGRYANENADSGPDATRLIYGDVKLARLADLKRAWDPENVFRLNHNVAPATG